MAGEWDGLSVVVPAWNEEDGLPTMVGASVAACERLRARGAIPDWEVVVVDDGSTDRTAEVVTLLAADEPRLRLVRHEANVGLGGAVTTGFRSARGAYAIYIDADLPFDLDEIGTALEVQRRSGAGVVAAYRRSRRGEGPRRAVYSYLYNLLVRSLFGLRVRDVNFAGKLLTREALDAVALRSRGSFIDVELLVRARNAGFEIVQFGVDYRPRSRGVSTLSSLPVIRTILVEMAELGPELRRGRGRAVTAAVGPPVG